MMEVNISTDLDKYFGNMAKEHMKKMEQGICPSCSRSGRLVETKRTADKFSFKCNCGFEYEEKRSR